MPEETICKVVHQYSSRPVSPEDMRKLKEVAADYSRVKNYVYQRYGGIRSLPKLYPGYTIQNEMTKSGLREELQLPSVYFYLALFDALGDIKTHWSKVKGAVCEAIRANEGLTAEDAHYLRFVMKVSGCFDNILAGREPVLPQEMRAAYEDVAAQVDTGRLNRYLCRQVRKHQKRLHTDKADGFMATERAYRYGDHGIYISTKEKRRRVFVPLTDGNRYDRQITVRLRPEKGEVEIVAPIVVRVRRHPDYENEVGLAMGIWHLLTTDSGRVYGERMGELHTELADFLRTSASAYRREKKNNPGREKYQNKKARLDRKLEGYVNQEINRMLREEKPRVVYLPKLPKPSGQGKNKRINYSVSVWRRGYVRERLEQKCRENGIELIEVQGKDISVECSACGQPGTYVKDHFRCGSCGYEADKKVNAARNARKRGGQEQVHGKGFADK